MNNPLPVEKLPHHEQLEFCYTRAKYRQGKKLTSVKVYTVNDESKYLIIAGIPAIKIEAELERLCLRYGDIALLEVIPNYPQEEFVEAYLVKYNSIKCARFAKNKLDGKSFYGGVLHVCYAPELETVEDTREKLADRRKSVAALTRYKQNACEVNKTNSTGNKVLKSHAAQHYLSKLRKDIADDYRNVLPAGTTSGNASLENVTTDSEFIESGLDKPCESNVLNKSESYVDPENNLNPSKDINFVQNSIEKPLYSTDENISKSSQQRKRVITASSSLQNTKKIRLFKNTKILSYKGSKDDS